MPCNTTFHSSGAAAEIVQKEGEARPLIKFISYLPIRAVYIIYNVWKRNFQNRQRNVCAAYGLLPAVFALSGVYANWNSVNVLLTADLLLMLSKNLPGLGISYLMLVGYFTDYPARSADVSCIMLSIKPSCCPSAWHNCRRGIIHLRGFLRINEVAKGKAFAMFTCYIETLKLNNFYTNPFNFRVIK